MRIAALWALFIAALSPFGVLHAEVRDGTLAGAAPAVIALEPLREDDVADTKTVSVVWPLATSQRVRLDSDTWKSTPALTFALPTYAQFYERNLQPSTGMSAARLALSTYKGGQAIRLTLPSWASRGAVGLVLNGVLYEATLELLPDGFGVVSPHQFKAPDYPLASPEPVIDGAEPLNPLRILDIEVSGSATAGQKIAAYARLIALRTEDLSGTTVMEWYVGEKPELVGKGPTLDLLRGDVGKRLRVRVIPIGADGTIYSSLWKEVGVVGGDRAAGDFSVPRDRVAVSYAEQPRVAFPVDVLAAPAMVVTMPASRYLGNESVMRVVREGLRAGLDERSMKGVLASIDNLYIKEGISGARALLSPQDTSQGMLEITLLEPQLGQVVFFGTRRAGIAKALTLAATGRPGELLDLKRVDGGLAAINETSRHRYRAVLREGREVGQSDLVVAVSEASLVDLSLGANNLGARETGRTLSSLRFGLYPEMGVLDAVSAAAVKAEGLRLTTGSVDLKLPLRGASLGVAHTAITTKYIAGPASQLDASGKSRSDTYRLSVPIYRHNQLAVEGGFSHSRDKNGTAYLGQLIQSNTKAEKNQFSVSIRRSQISLLSAKMSAQATATTSRGRHITYGVDDLETGVKSLRRALLLSGAIDFPQGYLLQARFDFARLAASDPDVAPGSEKYVVGSDKSRGYDQGQAIGDQGMSLSIEFYGKSLPVSVGKMDAADFLWRPRVFYDASAVRSFSDLTPDQTSLRGNRLRPYRDEIYSSLGIGIQLQTAKGLLRSGSLDGYIAMPMDDSVVGRSRSSRVGLTVSTLF